jgi:hypothetical protein
MCGQILNGSHHKAGNTQGNNGASWGDGVDLPEFPKGEKMRTALIFFLLALPTWAQEKATTAATAPACGPNNIKFDVTLDKSQHPVAQPDEA